MNDCVDQEKMQPELDKIKADAKKQKEENGVDTDVPEGFGKAQPDAETFRPVQIKSKKRKLDDVIDNQPISNQKDSNNKRKLEEKD